jgi:phospholipid/cholesterol/gamma-HCH transport system substrate-binding protein
VSARRPALARIVVVLAGAAVGIAIAVIVLGGDNRRLVRAEFDTARGLIPNNFVRVNGVRAGKISDVELTARGTALVTMRLDDWVPRPRADASAMIRPADLFGDVFLSLDPGHSAPALARPIGLARTANVGRLDDLLRVFQQPARDGLRATLVELGTALDQQGTNINSALLRARPALRAATGVMDQLASDRASLRSLIADSSAVVGQTAARSKQLDALVGHFAGLLHTTAGATGPLDADLRKLPATLDQLQDTTRRLGTTALEARPLAASVGRAAPGLATAATQLGPFLRQARGVVDVARPTIRRLGRLLAKGGSSFAALSAGLYELQQGSPQLSSLATTLRQAVPGANQFLAIATAQEGGEPGNQPGDPTTNPLRRYWRGAAVLSCESFGVAVKPGCLGNVLAGDQTAATRKRSRPKQATSPQPPPAAPSKAPATQAPAAPAAPATAGVPAVIDKVKQALDGVIDPLLGADPGKGSGDSISQLLDYLLKP